MSLIDFLREECIRVHSTAPDKPALLALIAELAKNCPVLDPVPTCKLLQSLQKREALGSTGFQNGVAIPHCLLDEVPDFVVGFVTHEAGVDFTALDGKPTYLIPFIIGPNSKRNDHIRLLSAISRVLANADVAAALRKSNSPAVLRESFLRQLGESFVKDTVSRRNLIIITIQDETLFHDTLQLFSEAEDCYLSVVNAQDCSEHLHSMPLFAAFWSESKKGFHRVIFASIKHSLANDLVRKLDTFLQGLKDKRGIFVQMLDVPYSAGSLDL
ncbi:MAG: hypothetical protein GF398_02630 [Chitinivibrionales bacterium]|nr:hypothetical protein [Chitinivibrionales bacterium]